MATPRNDLNARSPVRFDMDPVKCLAPFPLHSTHFPFHVKHVIYMGSRARRARFHMVARLIVHHIE